jgi:hypothetical protein
MTAQLGPIPLDLSAGFQDAVWLYSSWRPDAPEALVSIGGQSHSMSAVCALVGNYEDQVPDQVIERLMSYIREVRYTLLRKKLIADQSYATTAYCFLRLIEDRKRHCT